MRLDNVDGDLMIVVAIQDKDAVETMNNTEFCHLKPGLLSVIVIALRN